MINKEKKLVDHNDQIDGAKSDDHASDPFECAVETEKHEAKGDDGKFPDPEFLAMKVDHRTNDGVDLVSFRVQNHHGEERIENIETHNENQKCEQGRTVPVHVASLLLIRLSAEVFSSPQKGVATDQRGRFLSAVV